jgi:hypothetical protein
VIVLTKYPDQTWVEALIEQGNAYGFDVEELLDSYFLERSLDNTPEEAALLAWKEALEEDEEDSDGYY